MFWLPTASPFTVVLSPAPPELASVGSTPVSLDEPSLFAPYASIGAPGHDHPLLLLGEADFEPVVALVPIDADLPQRVDVLMRLWRRLNTASFGPPGALTAQRRGRLVETLRALDAHLDGASTREAAVGMYGADRLPIGAEWKAHDLRSRVRRLISSGRALMNGGYRTLLRTYVILWTSTGVDLAPLIFVLP